MFAMGALSVNEIRGLENLNSIGSDGDKRFVPMNFTTLEKAGEELEVATVAETQEEDEEEAEEMNDEMRAALASMERRISESNISGRIADVIDARLAPLAGRLDRIEGELTRVRDQVISENAGVDKLGAALDAMRETIAGMKGTADAADDDASCPADVGPGAVCNGPEGDSDDGDAGAGDCDNGTLPTEGEGTQHVEYAGDPGSDGYEPD
jgi:hypothetical protein